MVMDSSVSAIPGIPTRMSVSANGQSFLGRTKAEIHAPRFRPRELNPHGVFGLTLHCSLKFFLGQRLDIDLW